MPKELIDPVYLSIQIIATKFTELLIFLWGILCLWFSTFPEAPQIFLQTFYITTVLGIFRALFEKAILKHLLKRAAEIWGPITDILEVIQVIFIFVSVYNLTNIF
jgi:hypothetical protein